MSFLARLAAWCASKVGGVVVAGLLDWWRQVQARSDAIRIGRDQTTIDALEKAAEHERRMARENLTPPGPVDVDRRLRDGTF